MIKLKTRKRNKKKKGEKEYDLKKGGKVSKSTLPAF
jgi:hypothetical protein